METNADAATGNVSHQARLSDNLAANKHKRVSIEIPPHDRTTLNPQPIGPAQ